MNDQKKNKFESNKNYFTISVYALGVILIGSIIIKCIFNWAQASAFISNAASTLSPFFYGILIAYLINPLLKFINKTVLDKWLHIKSHKIRNALSLLLSYLIVIGMIFLLLTFVLPQVFISFYDLCAQIPKWYREIESWIIVLLNDIEELFPYFDFTWLENSINDAGQNLLSYSNISSFISTTIPMIFTTSLSIVKWSINMILAIMISCYTLVDKKILTRSSKRIVYAVFKKETSEKLLQTLKECNAIFSGFIYGKTVDSLIIGVISFIAFSIVGINYAPLLATVIGITNMIPYVGPFIGAIPGVIILVMVSPVKMIIYVVMVFIIQQFDGLYLGPKILGDTTGLRPLWIIFAITIGGALGGVLGMFLGVPFVAVVGHLIDKVVTHRLENKDIDFED